jgi:hypothetical protein
VGSDTEVVLPAAPDVIELAELRAQPSQVLSRGAANDAFNELFALPFRGDDVARFSAQPSYAVPLDAPRSPLPAWRWYLGNGLVAAGALGVTGGALTLISAKQVKESIPNGGSQTDVLSYNAKIHARNTAAGVEIGVGGAAIASGFLLLLWPNSPPVELEATDQHGLLRVRGTF